MGGIKAFSAITLGTFRTLFERIGMADLVLESLLEETRLTGHQILGNWEGTYLRMHVPEALIDKIRAHQDGLALVRELR